MPYIEILTGTFDQGFTKTRHDTGDIADAARKALALDVHLDEHAVEFDWCVVRILHPQLDQHAHLQPLAGQGFDTNQIDLYRLAALQAGTRAEQQGGTGHQDKDYTLDQLAHVVSPGTGPGASAR